MTFEKYIKKTAATLLTLVIVSALLSFKKKPRQKEYQFYNSLLDDSFVRLKLKENEFLYAFGNHNVGVICFGSFKKENSLITFTPNKQSPHLHVDGLQDRYFCDSVLIGKINGDTLYFQNQKFVDSEKIKKKKK